MTYYREDGPYFPKHECVVEFGSPDGRVVRVLVEELLGIVLPDAGGIVPLLVNPEGTKAVFDKHDQRSMSTRSSRRRTTRKGTLGLRADLSGVAPARSRRAREARVGSPCACFRHAARPSGRPPPWTTTSDLGRGRLAGFGLSKPHDRRIADPVRSGRARGRPSLRPLRAGENTNAIVRAIRTRRSQLAESASPAPLRRTAPFGANAVASGCLRARLRDAWSGHAGSIPHRTSDRRVQAIAALRRLRFTGPEITEVLRCVVLSGQLGRWCLRYRR
jgi:hypothetical protein